MDPNTIERAPDSVEEDDDSIIDLVFDRIESFACKDPQEKDPNKKSSGEKLNEKIKEVMNDFFKNVKESELHKPNPATEEKKSFKLILDQILEEIDTCGTGENAEKSSDKDVLDRIFDTVEEVLCQESNPIHTHMLKNTEHDYVDSVFEYVEAVLCGHLQSQSGEGILATGSNDNIATCASHESKIVVYGGANTPARNEEMRNLISLTDSDVERNRIPLTKISEEGSEYYSAEELEKKTSPIEQYYASSVRRDTFTPSDDEKSLNQSERQRKLRGMIKAHMIAESFVQSVKGSFGSIQDYIEEVVNKVISCVDPGEIDIPITQSDSYTSSIFSDERRSSVFSDEDRNSVLSPGSDRQSVSVYSDSSSVDTVTLVRKMRSIAEDPQLSASIEARSNSYVESEVTLQTEVMTEVLSTYAVLAHNASAAIVGARKFKQLPTADKTRDNEEVEKAGDDEETFLPATSGDMSEAESTGSVKTAKSSGSGKRKALGRSSPCTIGDKTHTTEGTAETEVLRDWSGSTEESSERIQMIGCVSIKTNSTRSDRTGLEQAQSSGLSEPEQKVEDDNLSKISQPFDGLTAFADCVDGASNAPDPEGSKLVYVSSGSSSDDSFKDCLEEIVSSESSHTHEAQMRGFTGHPRTKIAAPVAAPVITAKPDPAPSGADPVAVNVSTARADAAPVKSKISGPTEVSDDKTEVTASFIMTDRGLSDVETHKSSSEEETIKDHLIVTQSSCEVSIIASKSQCQDESQNDSSEENKPKQPCEQTNSTDSSSYMEEIPIIQTFSSAIEIPMVKTYSSHLTIPIIPTQSGLSLEEAEATIERNEVEEEKKEEPQETKQESHQTAEEDKKSKAEIERKKDQLDELDELLSSHKEAMDLSNLQLAKPDSYSNAANVYSILVEYAKGDVMKESWTTVKSILLLMWMSLSVMNENGKLNPEMQKRRDEIEEKLSGEDQVNRDDLYTLLQEEVPVL